MTSGVISEIAVTSPIGICASAVMNRKATVPSLSARPRTSGDRMRLTKRIWPLAVSQQSTSAVAKAPRMAMSWPDGRSLATIFTSVSLVTKKAMAPSMANMPRRLASGVAAV